MIILDVETTGLEPKKHSIVSIGAVDFFNPSYQFYQECRMWDGAEIIEEALKINGFTEQQIKDKDRKSLQETINDFLLWTGKCTDITLAGENPSFDTDFLKNSAERFGIKWLFGYRTCDLHTTGRNHYLKRGLTPPTEKRRTALNLDKILNYVGLPHEPKPHHALIGAKMEAEAFSRFIHGKFLLEEFRIFPIPSYLLISPS